MIIGKGVAASSRGGVGCKVRVEWNLRMVTWRDTAVGLQGRKVEAHEIVRAAADLEVVALERPLDGLGVPVIRDQEHILGGSWVAFKADLFGFAGAGREIEAVDVRGIGWIEPRTGAALAVASVLAGEVGTNVVAGG